MRLIPFTSNENSFVSCFFASGENKIFPNILISQFIQRVANKFGDGSPIIASKRKKFIKISNHLFIIYKLIGAEASA